jgi:hypothetical protein
VLVEVQCQAERSALELEQLVDRHAGKARDACDAIAHLEHPTYLGLLQARFEASRFFRIAAAMWDVSIVNSDMVCLSRLWPVA